MAKTTVAGYSWVVLLIMMLIYIVMGWTWGATIPFLPYYIRDLNLSFTEAGLILVVSALPMMFTTQLGGKMIPKLGSNPYKKLILISVAIMMITELATPYAPEFWSLLALRFIFGIGIMMVFGFGAMILIPWFGLKNAGQMVLLGIAGLIVGFLAVIYFMPAVNGLIFGFNYKNSILWTGGLTLVITTILWAIFGKEAKQ
jgi:MFS family permease